MQKNDLYSSLESEAATRLYELLLRVRFLRVHKPQEKVKGPQEIFSHDGAIQVEAGNKKYWILLEVKHNAQIRDARNAIDRFRRVSAVLGQPNYPVFISQYLSRSIRELCDENEIGYFDFSGNCLLEFDQVFIEREMPDAEKKERKRFKSLFSPKSSRVIRRLMQHPSRPWKVQHLALEAGVSAATVSLVKDKLLGDGYAAWSGESFLITQPDRLLHEWAKQYHSRDHMQVEYYANGTVDEVEKRFTDYCKAKNVDYALTMFSGAKRVANSTRGVQRAYSYLAAGSDIVKIARDLDLKIVESGGNFRLLVPQDDDVLFDKQEIGKEWVVSDLQLYLDLAGHPGRGDENAEYLLETKIKPQW